MQRVPTKIIWFTDIAYSKFDIAVIIQQAVIRELAKTIDIYYDSCEHAQTMKEHAQPI